LGTEISGAFITETYAAMDPAMQLVLAGAENINQSTRFWPVCKTVRQRIKGR
jgi:hypothetical protein